MWAFEMPSRSVFRQIRKRNKKSKKSKTIVKAKFLRSVGIGAEDVKAGEIRDIPDDLFNVFEQQGRVVEAPPEAKSFEAPNDRIERPETFNKRKIKSNEHQR